MQEKEVSLSFPLLKLLSLLRESVVMRGLTFRSHPPDQPVHLLSLPSLLILAFRKLRLMLSSVPLSHLLLFATERRCAVLSSSVSWAPRPLGSSAPRLLGSWALRLCSPAAPQLRSSAAPEFRSSAAPQLRRRCVWYVIVVPA